MADKIASVQQHVTEMIPDLASRKLEKSERQVDGVIIKAYWCGTVLRFDIKNLEEKPC